MSFRRHSSEGLPDAGPVTGRESPRAGRAKPSMPTENHCRWRRAAPWSSPNFQASPGRVGCCDLAWHGAVNRE